VKRALILYRAAKQTDNDEKKSHARLNVVNLPKYSDYRWYTVREASMLLGLKYEIFKHLLNSGQFKHYLGRVNGRTQRLLYFSTDSIMYYRAIFQNKGKVYSIKHDTFLNSGFVDNIMSDTAQSEMYYKNEHEKLQKVLNIGIGTHNIYPDGLSKRDLCILALRDAEHSHSDIADFLKISQKTVSRVLRKSNRL
jgi:hypothetical protein